MGAGRAFQRLPFRYWDRVRAEGQRQYVKYFLFHRHGRFVPFLRTRVVVVPRRFLFVRPSAMFTVRVRGGRRRSGLRGPYSQMMSPDRLLKRADCRWQCRGRDRPNCRLRL